jgi:hypothetical protein
MSQPREFYLATRLKTRGELRSQGYGILHIQEMMAAADDDTIDTVVASTPGAADAIAAVVAPPAPTPSPAPTATAAAGGNLLAIVEAFFTFLESPTGESILTTLLGLLTKV